MKRNFALLLQALLLGSILAFSGCGSDLNAPKAESGNTVQVEYTGKLADGTIFDSSVGKEPLEFTLGSGQVISGFDKAVTGMKVGESKTVTIPVEEAYGQRDEKLVTIVPKASLPEGLTPAIGKMLQGVSSDGSIVTVTITDVSDTTVTVDANHPLAGKDLIFELKLVAIK